MSPPIILRPIANDERLWMDRHSELVLWSAVVVMLGAFLFSPDHFIVSLRPDHSFNLWWALYVGLMAFLAISKSYHQPRRLADRQLEQLIITKRDITLKRSASGVELEEFIWNLRCYEIGNVSTVVAGGNSVFRLQRPTESKVWRFVQRLGVASGGRDLRAFGWVNDARVDVQNRPVKLSDFSMRTRKRTLADMWASDLGQVLIQYGYGPE